MPADRRTFPASRPVKTERTHEENQERAYIAASRRSDRSLEARIESARRASEIHKKRTGRALRVTEQDVINEEMYEEEDDDLPTQYQRLNAHLHTTSVMFNKKLHDYIATQHGVRNMFMSQYSNPSFQQYGSQQLPATNAAFTPQSNWLNPSMLPLQHFNPSSPQQTATQPQSAASASTPQQNFRRSPYQIPQRTNSHQRSLSIQLPQASATFDSSVQSAPAGVTTPQDSFRRMSLPPHSIDQARASSDAARPAISPTSTTKSQHQSDSPQPKSPTEASPHNGNDASSSYSFSQAGYPFTSQALSLNPLTMSLPPESQQFMGSALDPNDPRTALFMAGSHHLPQPFAPTYTYNPNLPAKAARASTADDTLVKTELADAQPGNMSMPSAGFFNTDAFLTPDHVDYNAFFDFGQNGAEFAPSNDEQGNDDSFVNWD